MRHICCTMPFVEPVSPCRLVNFAHPVQFVAKLWILNCIRRRIMIADDDAPRVHPTRIVSPFLLLILLSAGIVLVAVGLVRPWQKLGLNPEAQPRPVAARGELSEAEKMNISIYETA